MREQPRRSNTRRCSSRRSLVSKRGEWRQDRRRDEDLALECWNVMGETATGHGERSAANCCWGVGSIEGYRDGQEVGCGEALRGFRGQFAT